MQVETVRPVIGVVVATGLAHGAVVLRGHRADESRCAVTALGAPAHRHLALDGVQKSTRYPGGLALRFARVLRYRDDKSPAEADTIDAVRALY